MPPIPVLAAGITAAVLLAAPAAWGQTRNAGAQDAAARKDQPYPIFRGIYLAGSGGWMRATDSDLKPTTKIDLKDGGFIDMALGYDLRPIRFELDLGYHRSAVNTQTDPALNAGSPTAARGFLTARSAMANIYYDLYLHPIFRPYIGGGGGVANVELDSLRSIGGITVSGTDTAPAWQAMAGISARITAHGDLTLGYRFFAFDDIDVASGRKLEGFDSHGLELGFRITF